MTTHRHQHGADANANANPNADTVSTLSGMTVISVNAM
jgi:hypothetical protein